LQNGHGAAAGQSGQQAIALDEQRASAAAALPYFMRNEAAPALLPAANASVRF
jgi:hypothetical protein